MKSRKSGDGNVEILIAEDSATQREKLKHLLEQHGHSVAAVPNGREALALIRRRRPNLVISDILMPELDGYGLCKAVKSDAKLKDVPVMLVTTLSDPEDVIRGLECGADNFIRKPYDGHYLLSRIDYLLMNLEVRKNQKMQMGVEINLGGHRHFITAERQQILDLLISTYEQATFLNRELKTREQELSHSNDVLNGLYQIADGLNRAVTQQAVADLALERALTLPGIQAGWITLYESGTGHRLLAARNLPPALEDPGAMEGDCHCRRRLVSGELDDVTNILECERLGRAKGDTRGLRYHASVPLWRGDQTVGVMNLVGPEKGLFNEAELKVLYGVGNQVAVALERAHLHEHLEHLVQERTAALTAEVAERKRTEEALRRETQRYKALMETAIDGIHIVDRNGNLVEANPAFLQMIGYAKGETAGLRVSDWDAQWNREEVREKIAALMGGREIFETRFRRKDGSVCDAEISVSSVEIAGEPYLYCAARDITERKRAEGQLRTEKDRQQALLTKLQQTQSHLVQVEKMAAIGLLATGVAHEINNPASYIYSNLVRMNEYCRDLVRLLDAYREIEATLPAGMGRLSGELDAVKRQVNPARVKADLLSVVSESLQGIEHIIGIVNDLKEFSHVDSRESWQPADINKTLDTTVNVVWNELKYKAEVRKEYGVLPPVTCLAFQLNQVFMNLLVNAAQAIEGRGVITIRTGAAGQDVWVEIADTGVGIPKEHLDRIFEPFFTTKPVGKGTGLGLWISLGVVQKHRGRIEVVSEVGRGTAFKVWLPIHPAPGA